MKNFSRLLNNELVSNFIDITEQNYMNVEFSFNKIPETLFMVDDNLMFHHLWMGELIVGSIIGKLKSSY